MKKALRFLAVAVVAGLCAWAAEVFIVRPHRCNVEKTHLMRATSAAMYIPDEFNRTLAARRNLQGVRALIELCPHEINLYTLLGANEQLLGRREEAVEAYRQALALSPRAELYIEIAEILIELGRVDEAVESYVPPARYDRYFLNSIPDPVVQRRVELRLEELKRSQTR